MKIAMINAELLLMTDSGEFFLKRGNVVTNGSKIEYVGTQLPSGKVDRTINFDGDILMPGMINAHAHSPMVLFRGGADDLTLQSWLHDRIFPLEAGLAEEHIYWGAYLAFLEYVKNGITTIADMYFHPAAMQRAVGKCGISCVSVGGATDFGGQAKAELDTLSERYLGLNDKCENYKYMLGVHSEYLTTDKLIDGVVAMSHKYKAPLYAHLSETLTEVGECTVRRGGLTPTMYFHRSGFLDNGATFAHGVHIDKDDIDIMAASGVSVASNPSSNLKLASGIAPVFSMVSRGVNVCLGTDGAASNNALSIIREMYLVSTLAKYYTSDASTLAASDVLKMATINGAKALFYEDRGLIEAGKRADIVRVSVKNPNMMPHTNLIKHLVYSVSEADVIMTMGGGKILYEDGEFFIGESKGDIYKNCDNICDYLFKRAGFKA